MKNWQKNALALNITVCLICQTYHPNTPNPPKQNESEIRIGDNTTLQVTGESTWFSNVYSTDEEDLLPPWSSLWESVFNQSLNEHSLHYLFGGGSLLGIEDINTLPDIFMVKNAYPNPFNPSTNIKFTIPLSKASEKVNIQIFDIRGRLVCTLKDDKMLAGWHSVIWDGVDRYGNQVPSGAYFVRVILGNETKNKKIMLLR